MLGVSITHFKEPDGYTCIVYTGVPPVHVRVAYTPYILQVHYYEAGNVQLVSSKEASETVKTSVRLFF